MRALFFLLMLVMGARAEGLFEEANADYAAGRFREAAAGYESLLKRDGPRVAVLQNLGSAYHRLGEDGRAILAFERALLLKPRDPDLKANLKLARDRAAAYSTRTENAWTKLVGWRSRRAWSWSALVGAALLPVAAAGWVLRSGRRWRRAAVPTAVAGLGLASLSFAALRSGAEVESRGIVVGGPATLRISPFATADERGSLPDGRELRLGQEKNGYFWVSGDEGATQGWVEGGDVEPLLPR